MGREELLNKAMDEVSQMNDRRFLAFCVGCVALLYAVTRQEAILPQVLKVQVMVAIGAMTCVTVLALTLRPERNPVIKAKEEPQAPQEAK